MLRMRTARKSVLVVDWATRNDENDENSLEISLVNVIVFFVRDDDVNNMLCCLLFPLVLPSGRSSLVVWRRGAVRCVEVRHGWMEGR